uniref:Protein kinase domain-containing protein n=1 Tax=Macrostomum lignano TaxID=282301 RepID=A0A1I8F4Y8_9PLAT
EQQILRLAAGRVKRLGSRLGKADVIMSDRFEADRYEIRRQVSESEQKRSAAPFSFETQRELAVSLCQRPRHRQQRVKSLSQRRLLSRLFEPADASTAVALAFASDESNSVGPNRSRSDICSDAAWLCRRSTRTVCRLADASIACSARSVSESAYAAAPLLLLVVLVATAVLVDAGLRLAGGAGCGFGCLEPLNIRLDAARNDELLLRQLSQHSLMFRQVPDSAKPQPAPPSQPQPSIKQHRQWLLALLTVAAPSCIAADVRPCCGLHRRCWTRRRRRLTPRRLETIIERGQLEDEDDSGSGRSLLDSYRRLNRLDGQLEASAGSKSLDNSLRWDKDFTRCWRDAALTKTHSQFPLRQREAELSRRRSLLLALRDLAPNLVAVGLEPVAHDDSENLLLLEARLSPCGQLLGVNGQPLDVVDTARDASYHCLLLADSGSGQLDCKLPPTPTGTCRCIATCPIRIFIRPCSACSMAEFNDLFVSRHPLSTLLSVSRSMDGRSLASDRVSMFLGVRWRREPSGLVEHWPPCSLPMEAS